MFKRMIGSIVTKVVKIYAKTWVAKWFAKRAAAKQAAATTEVVKDVTTSIIDEARTRAADAAAGRGVYADWSEEDRKQEFNSMLDRIIHMTKVNIKLEQAPASS